MKAVTTGIWRPLRWLILLFCVGSAVLAAENNWLSSLRIGQMTVSDWLARLAGDSRSDELVQQIETTTTTDESTSSTTNTWLNTALFSQPATGWTLDSSKSAPTVIVKAQSSATAFQSSSSTLPTALFSSGFVGYSTGMFGPLPNVPTGTDGGWGSHTSGNWGTAANWIGGVIADGAGANAYFDLVDISTNVTVTLDTSRTIGNLYIGDTNGTHSYSINPSGGTSLTFDNGANTSTLQQDSSSAGDTIAAPIFLKNDLNVINMAPSNEFHITGNIASSANTGTFQTITTDGRVNISGNISNGSTGATVTLNVFSGTTILTGTNSYTGGTSVDQGGTLLVNGNNSAATGNVNVFGGSTLGGTGTVAGNVYTFDGTITGATTTTVGTLTLTGNVLLNTGEGGGTYLANLSGSFSDLLAITGSLTLGADTTLNIVGSADGVTTYVLATFASRADVFETVMGIPTGYNLVYNATDIELVPTAIPEPSTWIVGALALGGVAVTQRKRLTRRARFIS